ncbi:MAG TPA: hypothetical protein VFA03_02545 [Acetobacteraceae bacterium]|nr:hypothetical protein [Acetobacteraceae bacterium]
MATLTVGAGMQYATIPQAVAASRNGDVILVNAGTYTNQFLTINDSITLESVGGNVTINATEPPPNLKGLILIGDATHDPDVTIQGFVLTGAAIPKSDGNNGAGIRYQGGNLTLIDDTMSQDQDGILATPIVLGTGTVIVNQSTFFADGAGDGESHNIYIGHVAQFIMEDSVSEGAIVGHEVKSRALDTEILNNTIMDGPTGTSSYEIEICNGGTALIQGNTIEKGPGAQNPIMISYGPEGSLQPGSLTVTGNLMINDFNNPNAEGIANVTTIPAIVNGNTYSGLQPTRFLIGPGVVSGNVLLPPDPTPWVTLTASGTSFSAGPLPLELLVTGSNDGIYLGTAPGTVIATGSQIYLHSLSGVTNQITLESGGTIQSLGTDTITVGGTGRITASGAGSSITTEAGASYIISLSASGTVVSNGSDSITMNGLLGTLVANGNNEVINLTGGTQIVTLAGSGVISARGPDTITVARSGTVIASGQGSTSITTLPGASADITLSAAGTVISGGTDTITLSGNTNVTATGAGTTITTIGGTHLIDMQNTGTVISDGRDAITLGAADSSVLVNGIGASVTTAAGGSHQVTLARGGNLLSAGSDEISLTGGSSQVQASGDGTTITSLPGATDSITLSASGTIDSGGTDRITALGTSSATIYAAGTVTIAAQGASLTLTSEAGSYTQVTAGSGLFSYIGQGGTLDFIGGSGGATIAAGAGPAMIHFGSGTTTADMGTGTDALIFSHGAGGSDVITSFNPQLDTISFQGFSSMPVQSETVAGGSTYVTLGDGTQITFVNATGIVLPP